MSNFCVEGGITNPRCYTVETFDFLSEESIFDILLDVFKSELPPRVAQITDCQDKPMRIEESSIGIVRPQESTRLQLIVNPLGDIPTYADSLLHRTVEYNFELIITAANEVLECVTWELIRFKNVVESLLIGAEFAIDGYNSVYITPKGFNYFPIGKDGGEFFREGSYRFSVTVTQDKI